MVHAIITLLVMVRMMMMGVTKQYVTWKYYIRDGEKKSGPPMAPDISDNRYLFVTKSNRLKARLAMDAIAHL